MKKLPIKQKFNFSEFFKNNKIKIFSTIFLLTVIIIIYIIFLEYKKIKILLFPNNIIMQNYLLKKTIIKRL